MNGGLGRREYGLLLDLVRLKGDCSSRCARPRAPPRRLEHRFRFQLAVVAEVAAEASRFPSYRDETP